MTAPRPHDASAPPVVLTIAGSDPSAGAGVQADLKTIHAWGGYAVTVLTAVTAQSTRGVDQVEVLLPGLVESQLKTLLADVPVNAVKIGMLGSAEIAGVVTQALKDIRRGMPQLPVVWDPVLRATSGADLGGQPGAGVLDAAAELLPLCSVVTPNLSEALQLAQTGAAPRTRAELESLARAIRHRGPEAVVITGGHLAEDGSPDLWCDESGTQWLEGARVQTTATHGTGCTMSSALATALAQGASGPAALAQVKRWTREAMMSGQRLGIGSGPGPLDHLPAQRENAAWIASK